MLQKSSGIQWSPVNFGSEYSTTWRFLGFGNTPNLDVARRHHSLHDLSVIFSFEIHGDGQEKRPTKFDDCVCPGS